MRRTRGLVAALLLAAWAVGCAADRGPAPAPARVRLDPVNEGETRVVIGGDTMLDDLALPWLLKNGWDYSLAGLRPALAAADLAIVNLETAVTADCRRARDKPYSYWMLPEALEGLAQNGVRAVTLANNHLRDCGDAGIAATIANLDRAGIAHVGGGARPDEANRPLIVELGALRLGLLSLFDDYSSFGGDGTAPLTARNLRRLIGALRPQVDVLLVMPHWGANYRSAIDDQQRQLGRLAIDLGADAVVGHGAHIWQAMELHDGKPIVYSVGNAAFGTGNPSAAESLLAELTVVDRRLTRITLHPVSSFNRDPKVLWQPRLAEKRDAYRILNRFIAASKRMDATPKIVAGKAVLAL